MLDALKIESTEDSPEIVLNKEENVFSFHGNSMPENTEIFFSPIINWIEEYIKNPNESTKIVCNLNYLNSSSSRTFFEIFLRFEEIVRQGNKIEIIWNYSEDDLFIQEKGYELMEILEIPFKMVQI